MPGDGPRNLKPSDPKTVLRHLQADDEGRLPLARAALAAALLDPVNAKAADHLTDQQKAALRWDEQEGFQANSHRYFIPDAELDGQMLDTWTEFLQH